MALAPVGWLAGTLPAQATNSARTAAGLAKRRRASPVSIVGILFLGFLFLGFLGRERRRVGFDRLEAAQVQLRLVLGRGRPVRRGAVKILALPGEAAIRQESRASQVLGEEKRRAPVAPGIMGLLQLGLRRQRAKLRVEALELAASLRHQHADRLA